MALKCPNCSGKMREVKRHGVHIDYCPVCKGVWLDRGEIDKIVQSPTASSTDLIGTHSHELKEILSELRKEGRVS
ncbi:MAG TPA: zf-TFIIB domain-containing protein [Nitrososphaera sp.]